MCGAGSRWVAANKVAPDAAAAAGDGTNKQTLARSLSLVACTHAQNVHARWQASWLNDLVKEEEEEATKKTTSGFIGAKITRTTNDSSSIRYDLVRESSTHFE